MRKTIYYTVPAPGRPVERPLTPTSLSIIIPAYNEQARLPGTLDRIIEYMQTAGWERWEIIVVDDGSTDGTAVTAEAAHCANAQVRVLRNPGNRGKGYAVRHGILDSKMEWRLLTDADLSAPIEELGKLWNAVKDGKRRLPSDRVRSTVR